MRISIWVFGRELLTVDIGQGASEDETPDVDGGYLTSFPVGFVANHERPEESGLPYREGWE